MPVEFPERFNMADYFLYHNLEEGRENKVCLHFKDRTYTYGEAANMSNRAGNALRELGIGMEDRVLIVLPDCPEFVWTWFGAARIGAVITMVNALAGRRLSLLPRIYASPFGCRARVFCGAHRCSLG